ncbi:MAG: ATP F0F1 synthase subunit B [Devosia sp.]|jgi:F-type H+-transporting ATPase subunit b|nr:ATP F0F1 synthase subunit B [Devosia sp.]
MWDFWLNDASKGASVWAMIALVIFIGLLMYLGVHKTIAKMLDERIRKIEVDLAEAEQLRKEAKALLDDYARRREEAEKEAQSIVDAAREEAFRLTAEAKESLEAMVARREKAVTDKIAQAEAQAIAEVRARSADLAVEAARVVLTRQMATKGDALVDQSIRDVASKLN